MITTEEEHQDQHLASTGLYVDVENLHTEGQALIQGLIDDWPDNTPPPSHLNLYVHADQTELWKLWASSRFKNMEVRTHGTQHFSCSLSKNSADMAIVAHAMADLALKRITHVAVLSNDSDFISLYTAIRDDPDIPDSEGRIPFLWVITDRDGSLSPNVKRYFPPEAIHIATPQGVLSGDHSEPELPAPLPRKKRTTPLPRKKRTTSWDGIAQTLLETIPPGPFKSTDCQPIIQKHWPQHPIAKTAGSAFGNEFKNNIWPILKRHGVKIGNPGKNPVRYEMPDRPKEN